MTHSVHPRRRARRSLGFNLIEALIDRHHHLDVDHDLDVAVRRHRLMPRKNRLSKDRVRAVGDAESFVGLQALAATDPVVLFAQIKRAKAFAVAGGGSSQIIRDIQFTVESVVTPAPLSPKDGVPLPLSYDLRLFHRTSFGDVISVVVQIHWIGVATKGCDPADGVTIACGYYLVVCR